MDTARKMVVVLLLGGVVGLFPRAWPRTQEAPAPPAKPESQDEARMSFDPSANPALTSMLTEAGDILVRPLLNDKEVGWFVLDPSVEGMRIIPSLAEDLGLSLSRSVRLVTSSLAEERKAWLCPKFQLGPLTAEGLELTSMKDNSTAEGDFPVAGAVGTAVLRSVTAEIDLSLGAVRLYDPKTYIPPPTAWKEFKVAHSLPVVACRFEGDAEGEFGLDLRSPLGIVFFRHKVVELGLLENRTTRPGHITGAGFGRAVVRTGVLEWFEAAGLWLDEPQAVFVTQDLKFAASAELAGLLGRQALGDATLILDFSGSRLALMIRR